MPDSRRLFRIVGLLVAIACMSSSALAAPRSVRQSPRTAAPDRASATDILKRVDINDLSMVVTNVGSFGYDIASGGPGLEYPRNSGKTLMFAGGLWLGARVNGAPRVAIAEYSNEFGPGPIIGGLPANPFAPQYVVYKLNRDNADPNLLAAYNGGAVPYGAPPVTVLPDNTLDIPGDQMLWCVYNDADPSWHDNNAGATEPLGVEIQQTIWAYNDPGPLGRTIYMSFRIINKSGNTLDSLYVGLWADPDLGGFSDDLAGSRWELPLGYAYNATNNDEIYGAQPPAFGFTFIDWEHSYTGAFSVYPNGGGPQSANETYNFLRGRLADGTPIVDPASGTAFMFTGDPITGSGSLDSSPSDRRFLLSVGPVVMAPGDTVTPTWALVVGHETDRLSSLARLECDAPLVKNFWLQQHLDPPRPVRLDCPIAPSCPRSSGFWADQCGPTHDFDAGQMGLIAAAIDGRSRYFDWTASAFNGFCQTFLGPETERRHAEREFASLLANLSTQGMLPQSGNPVSLNEVPISCDGLAAGNISDLAGTAVMGLAADYLDLNPTHPVPVTGTGFSSGAFNNGAYFGDQFFGSSLHPNAAPDSFPRVELRFGGTQSAHRYLRFTTTTGGLPVGGSRYQHAGHYDLPFTVWDADRNVQLEVGFSEMVVVDDDGTILPSAFQRATFDSTWLPDTTSNGAREFLFIFRYAYGSGPESELTAENAILNGDLPVVYGMAVKRITGNSQFDDGDQFFIEMVPTGNSIDALMLQLAELPAVQANPVYQQISNCLSPINRGIGIGPTCDLETAVLISLIEANRGPDGIQLAWYATEPVSVTIERRVDNEAWIQLAMRAANGSGRITYDDRDVFEGHRYSYRLRYRDEQGDRTGGEAVVDLSASARMGLVGFAPNPARGRAGVCFSLASDHPATLTIHDIAGRRVGSYEVGRLGRGSHRLQLEQASMASGVYLLRLTQDGRTMTARSALVR